MKLLEDNLKEELCKMYDDVTSSTELDMFTFSDEQSRYDKLEFYQQGGQKIIYKGFDKKTDRPIALAKLHEGASENELEFFVREARINAFLQHPNIIPVYDMGKLDNDYYFCMKFIEGETLEDILNQLEKKNEIYQSKYPLNKLLEIFLRVCDAILYAHSKGILHLDLKPSNIKVDEFGNVVVCDWGLSKVSDDCELTEVEGEGIEKLSFLNSDAENLTMLGYAKGSPGYMAPEQTGKSKFLKSEKTDIYALGAILYTLLCLKKPIEGSIEEVIDKTVQGAIEPLASHNAKAPKALVAISAKAMSLDPDGRYHCVSDVIKDVYAYRDNYATSAEDIGVIRLLVLAYKRNQALAITVLLCILILSLVTIYYIRELQTKEVKALNALYQAEQNLELYKQEKVMREVLSDVGVDFFLSLAREKLKYHQYEGAVELLEKLPKDEFNQEQLTELYSIGGRVAFISQQFNRATELFTKAGEEDQFLLKLSKKYTLKKTSDEEMFNGDMTVKLMNDLVFQDTPILRDIFNHYKRNYVDLHDFVKVIREFVMITNLSLGEVNLKLIEKQGKFYLDVSDNPGLSYLPGFPNMKRLSGVNFSNSGLHSMQISNLIKLSLEELNVSGCDIKDFSFLKKCKNLKKLVVSPEDTKTDSFKKYTKGINVKIKN